MPAVSQYTQVPCPSCQRSLRVRKEYSGKVIACRYCDHAFYPKLPVQCPHCRKTLHVRIGYLGKRITCKHCDHSFRTGPEDAPPADGADADPAVVTALRIARLEVTALEEHAQRLRDDLAAREAPTSTGCARRPGRPARCATGCESYMGSLNRRAPTWNRRPACARSWTPPAAARRNSAPA
jgi:ribosomal protein L37AE/L43A